MPLLTRAPDAAHRHDVRIREQEPTYDRPPDSQRTAHPCKVDLVTHYDTLGILRTASAAEVKAAYRKLIRKHHPDIAGERGRDITDRVNEAWDALRDETSRRAYDRELSDAAAARSAEEQTRESASQPKAAAPDAPATDPFSYTYVPDAPAGSTARRSTLLPQARWVTVTLTIICVLGLAAWGFGVAYLWWNANAAPFPRTNAGPPLMLALASLLTMFRRRTIIGWIVLGVGVIYWPLASAPGSWIASSIDGVSSTVYAAVLALAIGSLAFRLTSRSLWSRFNGRR